MKYGYIAAQYTIGQGVVTMRVRAMAIAVLLFIANLIGYGFGPLFIGYTSDVFFAKCRSAGARRRNLLVTNATPVRLAN